MKWVDAEKLLKQGAKITSPRLGIGAYVVIGGSGNYKLITSDEDSMDWNPAGSDQLADTWDVLS